MGRRINTHNKKLNTQWRISVQLYYFPLYMMYIYSTMVWLLVLHSKVTWTPLWLFAFHTYPWRIRCSKIPPLNPKGYMWVQEESCNTNLQSMHGSTWAESTPWNVGQKRWFKDDHQHWNAILVAVPGTLPKLARSWKLLLEELSLIKKGDLRPKRREVYYLWWF